MPYNHISIQTIPSTLYIIENDDNEFIDEFQKYDIPTTVVIEPKKIYSKKEQSELRDLSIMSGGLNQYSLSVQLMTLNSIRENTFDIDNIKSVDDVKNNKYYRIIWSYERKA